jgi:hypothetical protein
LRPGYDCDEAINLPWCSAARLARSRPSAWLRFLFLAGMFFLERHGSLYSLSRHPSIVNNRHISFSESAKFFMRCSGDMVSSITKRDM